MVAEPSVFFHFFFIQKYFLFLERKKKRFS
jgi:hypothetical protein